jgi:hypothetical protein
MTESYISDEMRAATGRELRRKISYPITESDIRRWALAVYYPELPPQRFLDASDGPMPAPEELNPFAWRAAHEEPVLEGDPVDPDLTERLLGLTPPGLGNQLNGGVENEYHAPMHAGDVITSVVRLMDYSEREGRLGRMLITRTEDEWTNQRADVVRRQRFTLIRYR